MEWEKEEGDREEALQMENFAEIDLLKKLEGIPDVMKGMSKNKQLFCIYESDSDEDIKSNLFSGSNTVCWVTFKIIMSFKRRNTLVCVLIGI